MLGKPPWVRWPNAVKHTRNSGKEMHNTSISTNCFSVKIGRDELNSVILSEVQSEDQAS